MNLHNYEMACGHRPDAQDLDGKPVCLGCGCNKVEAYIPHMAANAPLPGVCQHDNFQVLRNPANGKYSIHCHDCQKTGKENITALLAMVDFLNNWEDA